MNCRKLSLFPHSKTRSSQRGHHAPYPMGASSLTQKSTPNNTNQRAAMRHLAFSLERAARAMRAQPDRAGGTVGEGGGGSGGGGGGGGVGSAGGGGREVERLVVFISLEDFSMWTAPNLSTTRETIDMVPATCAVSCLQHMFRRHAYSLSIVHAYGYYIHTECI